MSMAPKQVDKSHYAFARYVSKRRWVSMWHQVNEVLNTGAQHVLEIGPGPGVFKATMAAFNVKVETVDLDPELAPDHLCSVTEMPFGDASYDAVCAFQMLEHLPFEKSLQAFSEMARVSRKHIIISLPDSHKLWRYLVTVPKRGEFQFNVPRPSRGPKPHIFDGEHYWEVNKAGYQLQEVAEKLSAAGSVRFQRTYRVPEFTYHRFFVFEKE